jgi:hypothetical protein
MRPFWGFRKSIWQGSLRGLFLFVRRLTWRLRAGQAGVRFPAANSVRASDNEAMAMTEQEWLTCENPRPMLWFLIRMQGPVLKFERKLRLFTVACCRRPYYRSEDQRYVQAIDLTERVAEDFHDQQAARQLYNLHEVSDRQFRAARAWGPLIRDQWKNAFEGAMSATNVEQGTSCLDEILYQVALLHDIFGNPFRPVTLNSAWRTSNVTALAQSIYDDRAFDRMPILADALEDAGCDNADMLNHCRQPGVHVRGCWVVDLGLGRE